MLKIFPFIAIFLIYSNCNEKPLAKNNSEATKVIIPEKPVESVEITPVDSLKLLFLSSMEDKFLLDIETLALPSDASLTTDIGSALSEIFDKCPQKLLSYMVKNNSVRFKEILTNNWSEGLSVYEGKERETELSTFKSEKNKNLKPYNLTNKEKEFLRGMLNSIDPSVFD